MFQGVGSRSRSGGVSHREVNIDEALGSALPENRPLNFRPRPRSEVNLSYSIQVRRSLLYLLLHIPLYLWLKTPLHPRIAHCSSLLSRTMSSR